MAPLFIDNIILAFLSWCIKTHLQTNSPMSFWDDPDPFLLVYLEEDNKNNRPNSQNINFQFTGTVIFHLLTNGPL